MKLQYAIPFNEVMLVWLKAEWYNNRYDGVREFINVNKLDAFCDEKLIKTLLFIERHTILKKLPLESTRWYVATITNAEYQKLKLINEYSWGKMFNGERNLKEAARLFNKEKYYNVENFSYNHITKINEIIKSRKALKLPIILINQKGSKQTVILEGNHRAMAKKAKGEYYKNVIIGISPEMKHCAWL